MKNINYLKNMEIAHRGIHNNTTIPENSFAAFAIAKARKISIELDIRLTKDHQIVVFHDKNLKRMTGIDKNLSDCSLKEIKSFKLLNTTSKIPLFSEILTLIDKDILIDIEIKEKNHLICNKLVQELKNYNGNIIISSFYPNIINWFRRKEPKYIRGLIIGIDLSSRLVLPTYCKPDFLAISKKQIQFNKIQKFRDNGTIIFAWTIKEQQEKDKYKNYADSFISNIEP